METVDPTPVWLLDIDGVVNAISRKPDRSAWPRDQWVTGTASSAGADWPILAAQPVLDFIRTVHESGRAEVRWHTTWQHDARNLARLLRLPRFATQDSPEFGEREQLLAGAAPVAVHRGWWKYPAAERVVRDEGRPLVWTDDDATWELRAHDNGNELSRLAPTLIVSPQTHLGLTPKHLRNIDAFLSIQAPRPSPRS
ncbi:hypothetical protein OG792_25675 [Micromonospora sp. NBC_01699]|uniref:hypothetical protein n=1 Tax=Micromonospora sp. NBC_01699 TaxID=2975984 RepID=UPI002E2E4061|nr:hypothetical protein [Micromonospora sp. NBC_01699]